MTKPKRGRKNLESPTPKSIKVGFTLNDKPFRWSFEKCLWQHEGWQDCESIQFFTEHIISKLQKLENVTWQEILDASGGKSDGRGNNNHFIPATKLPYDERKIFAKLGYMKDFEKVFSLRLSGKERLIGVVDMNVFEILWFDAKHKFF